MLYYKSFRHTQLFSFLNNPSGPILTFLTLSLYIGDLMRWNFECRGNGLHGVQNAYNFICKSWIIIWYKLYEELFCNVYNAFKIPGECKIIYTPLKIVYNYIIVRLDDSKWDKLSSYQELKSFCYRWVL